MRLSGRNTTHAPGRVCLQSRIVKSQIGATKEVGGQLQLNLVRAGVVPAKPKISDLKPSGLNQHLSAVLLVQ
jgi:hypothetical protein